MAVPDAVAGLPAWKARIVIDATNRWMRIDDKLELADLGGRTSSQVGSQRGMRINVITPGPIATGLSAASRAQ
jgi:hypothetical protein